MNVTRAPGWAAGVVVLVMVVTAGCSDGGGSDGRPGAATTTSWPSSTTSTSLTDYTGVTLAVVPGSSTTTTLRSGFMTVSGTVRGPDGPVAGATVRLERFDVAGRATEFEVGTDGAGRYQLRGAPGGRYRVRAWRSPDLVQGEPVVGFLAATPDQRLDLVTERVGGVSVAAATAPDPAREGQAVNLAVSVTERVVDGDGVVRHRAVGSRPVSLGGLGAWVSADGSRAVRVEASTDGAGRASFALRCVRPGPAGLTLRVAPPAAVDPVPAGAATPAAASFGLDVADCVETATGAGSGSSSTTAAP